MQQRVTKQRDGLHLRLPEELKDWYRAVAHKHESSMNNEIVRALIAHKEATEKQEARRNKRN